MIPKFRAWDKTGKLYQDDEVSIVRGHFVKSSYTATWWADDAELFNAQQSTGLKDKNGGEIYEGDICECVDGLKNYWYVIEWIYAGWQVVTYKKPHTKIRGISDGINQAYLEPDYSSQLKIIGNIYENPELLEAIE